MRREGTSEWFILKYPHIKLEWNIDYALQDKCAHYWPVDNEPMYYGDVQVEIKSELKNQEWVITEIAISKVHDCTIVLECKTCSTCTWIA